MSYSLGGFFNRTYKCDICKKEKLRTNTKDFIIHDIPQGWHHAGGFEGFTLCDSCYALIDDHIKTNNIRREDWFGVLYSEAMRRRGLREVR